MALFAVILLPYHVRTQALYGALTGNVSDSSGAAVAGAKITVTNNKTNESRETQSNSDGGYSLPNLTGGEYTIDIMLNGFQSFQATNVPVRGEAFNFANTPHWALPAANISAVTYNPGGSIKNLGGFGSITNTDASYLGRASMDERTIRFGLRVSF